MHHIRKLSLSLCESAEVIFSQSYSHVLYHLLILIFFQLQESYRRFLGRVLYEERRDVYLQWIIRLVLRQCRSLLYLKEYSASRRAILTHIWFKRIISHVESLRQSSERGEKPWLGNWLQK